MKKSLFATGLAIAMALPFGAQAADYVIDTKGAHASINLKLATWVTVSSKVVSIHFLVTFLLMKTTLLTQK